MQAAWESQLSTSFYRDRAVTGARFFRKVLEKLDDATIPRDSFLHFVWRRRFWKKEQKTLR